MAVKLQHLRVLAICMVASGLFACIHLFREPGTKPGRITLFTNKAQDRENSFWFSLSWAKKASRSAFDITL